MTEAQIQAAFYKEAYNRFPQIRGLLFAIPNGGTRNIREATLLKATGTTPGIPDMILIHPLAAFEFKTATGTLSLAQVKIHSRWGEAGIKIYICRSSSEALGILQKLLLT